MSEGATMELILWRHAEAEDGSPDSARKLTEHGREQALRVAAWLKPRLPGNCEVLVSPAARAQQTAQALGVAFVMSPAVGTDAVADEEPEPSRSEVITVRRRKGVAHKCDSESVLRSTECPTFHRRASRERSIDFRESVSLGLAVGPAR